MDRNCLTCHFLCKEHREANTGRALVFVLSPAERETLRADPDGFDRGWHALKCYMGVWDEGVAPIPKTEDGNLLSRPRGHSCFYFPHQSSMLLPAAVELQKRADSDRRLNTQYRYTVIGLWIAGIGLILNALAVLVRAVAS